MWAGGGEKVEIDVEAISYKGFVTQCHLILFSLIRFNPFCLLQNLLSLQILQIKPAS